MEEALQRASEGVATLVIAHRLRSIENCDRIYVLQDGLVVEVGSYDELMNRGELFFSMVNQQVRE